MHIQNELPVHSIKDEEILSKDEVRKANLVRQLPYSDAIDSHDLVESIKDGTGTSVRNEDKIAYSKNFLDIYNGFQMHITYSII
jgi:hypothetical protein